HRARGGRPAHRAGRPAALPRAAREHARTSARRIRRGAPDVRDRQDPPGGAHVNVAEAYRRGRVAFMGLDLLVAPGALVPRAETELLGRCALDALAGIAAPRVIDMCCGAGNLACVIGTRRRDARVW